MHNYHVLLVNILLCTLQIPLYITIIIIIILVDLWYVEVDEGGEVRPSAVFLKSLYSCWLVKKHKVHFHVFSVQSVLPSSLITYNQNYGHLYSSFKNGNKIFFSEIKYDHYVHCQENEESIV